MSVAAMNHFTVLSDDLEATRRFYCDLFGFKVGWRPPFQFPGWWLYADDDTPILHVIHSQNLPADRGGRQHLKIMQLLAAVEADASTPLVETLIATVGRLRGAASSPSLDFALTDGTPGSCRALIRRSASLTPPLSHRALRGGAARRVSLPLAPPPA
jgi:catechol 2,3-dioxygenase-like lactoylglutathione lyase family enzyme